VAIKKKSAENILRDPQLYKKPYIITPLSAVNINAEATLWTPAGGKRFRLIGGLVSIGTAAGNVIFKDGAGGATFLILPQGALNDPFPFRLGDAGYLSAAVNNPLRAQGAATATISGHIYGYEE
jgi:hypothetical protein